MPDTMTEQTTEQKIEPERGFASVNKKKIKTDLKAPVTA